MVVRPLRFVIEFAHTDHAFGLLPLNEDCSELFRIVDFYLLRLQIIRTKRWLEMYLFSIACKYYGERPKEQALSHVNGANSKLLLFIAGDMTACRFYMRLCGYVAVMVTVSVV